MSERNKSCNGGRQPEAVTPEDLERICCAYAKVFFPRRPHDPSQPSAEEVAELQESLEEACTVKLPVYQSDEYSGPVYLVVWASGPCYVSVFVENDDRSLRHVVLDVFD